MQKTIHTDITNKIAKKNADKAPDKQEKNCQRQLGQARYIVRQYNLNGELVREYKSYSEAEEETGVRLIYIQQTCYGARRSAGGFLWKKGRPSELPEKLSPVEEKPRTWEAKPIRQRKQNGDFVALYASVNQAAQAVKRDNKEIRNAALGRQKTCAGFIWDFVPKEELAYLCSH